MTVTYEMKLCFTKLPRFLLTLEMITTCDGPRFLKGCPSIHLDAMGIPKQDPTHPRHHSLDDSCSTPPAIVEAVVPT